MKSSKKLARDEPKKRGYGWFFAILAAIALGCLFYPFNKLAEVEPDVEKLIRSSISKEVVFFDNVPCILYSIEKSGKEMFGGSGTLVVDRDHGLVLITSEHILRRDNPMKFSLKAVPLQGGGLALDNGVSLPFCFATKVWKSSKDLNGQDIMILELGLEPVLLPKISGYGKFNLSRSVWADVVAGSKKVSTVRSVSTGKDYTTRGYFRYGVGDDGPVFIIIDKASVSGESGSGFRDEFGGLWVLHATTFGSNTGKAKTECLSTTGKPIEHISVLSGPLGGKYN